MFVHQDSRVFGTETLALRLRENRERLVHQHHGRDALLPCFKRVAHGGASAGPSSTDANHQIINRRGDSFELCLIQRTPRIIFVRPFNN